MTPKKGESKMNRKRAALYGLVLGLALSATSARAQERIDAQNVGWALSTIRVVDAGTLTNAKEGALRTGIVLRANAKARGTAPVGAGTWTATLTSFTPAQDMPGQKAGVYYVRGEWQLRGRGASGDHRVRHDRDLVKGMLVAELTFDPTTNAAAWNAVALMPKTTVAGKWGQGTGTIHIDTTAGGELTLALAR
jgi:hypothetical protein